MVNYPVLNRLIEKFSGRITPDDDKILSDWIGESIHNKLLFETLLKIWENTPGKIHHPEADTENEWLRLQKKIARKSHPILIISNFKWLAIAASLVVFILAGMYIFRTPLAEVPAITFTTNDQVMNFYLPDSSHVWLNINSELSYDKKFGQESREVNLKGEGYFAVTHDTIPFSVTTQLVTIRVLGTEFNIKTGDSTSVVSVAQGKVKVESGMITMELTNGESGIVCGNTSIKKELTSLDFATWRGIRDLSDNDEQQFPQKFLVIENSYRKNKVDQTVVEGSIENKASTAAYKDIVLKISYKKSNGRISISLVPIEGTLKPGEKIRYRKRLPNLFSKSRPVKVEIGKVEVR